MSESIKANIPVTWHLSGSGQPGNGVTLSEDVGGYTTVAVNSLFGEKANSDGVRSVMDIPTKLLKEVVAAVPAGVAALILAFLLLACSFTASAQTYSVPLNNVITTGSNTYNLPSALQYGTNTQFNGSAGYYNSNNPNAVQWTTPYFNKTTLTLYGYNLNTNAQSVTVGLLASSDGSHWALPSTFGGTYPAPNYLGYTVAANTAVSTNSQMYQIATTNFDSYGITFWAIGSVTNIDSATGTLGGPTTNQITLNVNGKQGL